MEDNHSVSVVIPVFNEAESLEKLYRELAQVLEPYSNWEIIFVDDGSDDNSYPIMRQIAEKDSRIATIQFFKNFGKVDALSEGFKHTMGDIVITMGAGDIWRICDKYAAMLKKEAVEA